MKRCTYHAHVAAIRELVLRIIDISDASRHSRSKIATGSAEDDNPPAGHILAAVISHPFHHGDRARVSHRKSIPCYTGKNPRTN